MILKKFDVLFKFLNWHNPKRRLPTSIKKILIIKLSAMGDALCLMPAVRYLYDSLDKSIQIDWLTTKRTNPFLFEKLKFINSINLIPFDINLPFFFARLFSRLGSYDVIIDFDQYYQITEWISRLGKYSVGFKTERKGKSFNLSSLYSIYVNEKQEFKNLVDKLLAEMGIETHNSYSSLLPEIIDENLISENYYSKLKTLNPNLKNIVIYPGSSTNAIFRRWDVSNYITLAQRLTGKANVIIAGGSDELSLMEKFPPQCRLWINEFSLFEWAKFFKEKTFCFVGNDGGLLHLANSQMSLNQDKRDRPRTIGIFGPNLSNKWGGNERGQFNYEGEQELSCKPCIRLDKGLIPSICARGDLICFQELNPERILNWLEPELVN